MRLEGYIKYTYIELAYHVQKELNAPRFRCYARIHPDWNLQS